MKQKCCRELILSNLHEFQAKSAVELTARSYVEMLFLSAALRASHTYAIRLTVVCIACYTCRENDTQREKEKEREQAIVRVFWILLFGYYLYQVS